MWATVMMWTTAKGLGNFSSKSWFMATGQVLYAVAWTNIVLYPPDLSISIQNIRYSRLELHIKSFRAVIHKLSIILTILIESTSYN